jgi:hypothetical protein
MKKVNPSHMSFTVLSVLVLSGIQKKKEERRKKRIMKHSKFIHSNEERFTFETSVITLFIVLISI